MVDKYIVLIRHFPTSMNKSGKYMGRKFDPDIELTKSDLSQFSKKISFLKSLIDIENVKLFSSPALRCKQTMNLVVSQLGIKSTKVTEDNDFWETNMGDVEGMNIIEISKKYPRLYKTRVEKASKTRFPNGESYLQVQSRAWKGLQKALVMSGGDDIIICTHVDVMKFIIFKVLNVSIDNKNNSASGGRPKGGKNYVDLETEHE